ncbi:hypothetical protein THASP1DRAFT_32324 [Thamnocephalis sphaerospora]|uniref:Uncharacterized protein n=1 Tax=Thamnocephalis sphaerospora TaxID=78915 RepID=A0A4P9XJB2_9FUNG|nr:hypothetical protein THASP1DRAFT_32324 [Thamnocephalis sphaerospora]|eukprot:RKP05844.1 hypothetical protein THASP1DRAFT_32324 [Thamnocephalis sphaerospora]
MATRATAACVAASGNSTPLPLRSSAGPNCRVEGSAVRPAKRSAASDDTVGSDWDLAWHKAWNASRTPTAALVTSWDAPMNRPNGHPPAQKCRRGASAASSAYPVNTVVGRLPTETLSAIFHLLRCQPEDLRACERVCRRWRDTILPILWHAPQIYFAPLLDERHRCLGSSTAGSSELPNLGTRATTTTLTMDTPTVYTIRVRSRPPLDVDNVPVGIPLQERGKWIRQLDLWPAYSFVRDATVCRFMQHCIGLRTISLHGCIFITDESLCAIASACSATLLTINLSYCTRVTDAGVAVLARACASSLEQVNLRGCVRVTDQGLRALSHCSRLLRARLSELPKVSDTGLWALAQGCPRLQWLDLTGTNGCSDATAEALGRYCPRLAWLSMARIPSAEQRELTLPQQHHNDYISAPPTSSLFLSGNNDGRPLNNRDSDDAGGSSSVDPLNSQLWLEDNDDDSNSEESMDEAESVSHHSGSSVLASSSTSSAFWPPRGQRSVTAGLTDRGIAHLVVGCPQLSFLDLSFHHRLSDYGVERLAQEARYLVHVALIGCTNASERSLYALASLRRRHGRLACITMGGTPQLDEETVRRVTSDPTGLLKGWRRADAAGYATRELPGIAWLGKW